MEHMYIAPIKKELLVNASQQTCFKVFTENMDSWWPKTHHVGATRMTELVLEPHIKGRWYSKHEDGAEVNVGHVLEWNPFDSIILNWQIDGNFKYNQDLTTEVEVRFIPVNENTTRVMMEHRNLERLGGGKGVESMDQGWGMIMGLYKKLADIFLRSPE